MIAVVAFDSCKAIHFMTLQLLAEGKMLNEILMHIIASQIVLNHFVRLLL